MIKLEVKLALFNLFSKLVFTALFLIFMPYIIERINLRQVDNELIQKREKIIDLISDIGIEPFIASDTTFEFGSFNILKEEFIGIERVLNEEDLNYIEVAVRLIDGEEIDYRVLNYTFIVDGQKYLIEIGKSLTAIQQTRMNITKVIFIFIVFIIIITLLTDLQYNRYLLKPLNKIIRKLNGISDPSLFDKTRIDTSTSDFHQLDHALREMMGHIDELFRKEKDITVNISHELLTPVSVIRSKLENLLLAENIDSGISVRIEDSLKTLHRLQSLVNSLLLIARIESRQYLREESLSVVEVLREVVSEVKPIADDIEIKIHEEYKEDIILSQANRSLLFSMFYNIVNNAVKNTLAGGSISIETAIGEQNILKVNIADTGRGMTEKQMATLFSRFKTSNGSKDSGTGIGLAIAKTIADFHNIKISVDSELNKGTSFSFSIPSNS
jgi:signal transduction histidine kinase